MRRQVVIGGLVGIALGGLITFSFAHGFVSWPAPADSTVEQAPAPTGEGDDEGEVHGDGDGDVGYAPHRPLRPGSDRVGTARTKSQALAAAAPDPAEPGMS